MLLAVDVGNTQIAAGLFDGEELRAHWRIATRSDETEDELAAVFTDLLELVDLKLREIDDVIIASVVPSLTASFTEMSRKIVKAEPIIVGPGVKTGLPILYDNPHEVGADRIVNAVAGFAIYGGPLVIVDFGTATTFDAVSANGEYLGGAIAPGVLISAEALFSRAARLSRVDFLRPPVAIGKNTRASIQSGVILGSAGMVDSLVRRIASEMGGAKEVLATGGLAEMIVPECESVTRVEPHLTLNGLRAVYELNRR
ncbi:MAG: type III pantothenate kinase [Actinobacteria bacterium]|nr:type III pantothenate kinase [Actinomycetota bacterium]